LSRGKPESRCPAADRLLVGKIDIKGASQKGRSLYFTLSISSKLIYTRAYFGAARRKLGWLPRRASRNWRSLPPVNTSSLTTAPGDGFLSNRRFQKTTSQTQIEPTNSPHSLRGNCSVRCFESARRIKSGKTKYSVSFGTVLHSRTSDNFTGMVGRGPTFR
jgi:hypothetical protein